MTNDAGRRIREAGPSVPVEITGLSEVPNAGDVFNAVKDEKMARELVEKRKFKEKEEAFKRDSKATLDDLFSRINDGVKELNLIVKADVHGSAEAVKASLEKLSNEEVKVKVIHAGVGAITESDIMLASASNAIIIGFNIRPDKQIIKTAEEQTVEIRVYRVIYECIGEVEAAMKGLLAPVYHEVILGRATVRQCIRIPNVGIIAGSYVTDGKITRGCLVRVLRDSVVIFEDKVSSLKRLKNDAKEVMQGYECGIGLEKFNDLKVDDVFEAYVMEETER
jgi:translation initiation factor IF-2